MNKLGDDKMKRPVVLCILDGCGMRKETDGNAFSHAKKPNFDFLWNHYPHSLLEASGTAVGLPEGQMGNSEVGHMNIGAGRVVYQPLEFINQAILDRSFFQKKEFLEVFDHVKKHHSTLHFMGLLSDGGVHSHINHFMALIDMCQEQDIHDVCFHVYLDGRDVDPHSAGIYLNQLEEKIAEVGFGTIATISGRYYAMDRDNNYDRLKKAYDAIVFGEGDRAKNYQEVLEKNYAKDITDEFMTPTVLADKKIEDEDGIIVFNFRPDRLREMMTALTNPDFQEMEVKHFSDLKVVTMMPVTESVLCPSVFQLPDLKMTLGAYLEKCQKTQLRIAETEKYAHVTYFFDGGIEENYKGMKKILIPSPKVATYDLKPEMSALEVTDTLLKELDQDVFDVVILNYANGDMVGHTGVYEAAIKAVEVLDECLGRLYQKVKEKEGILLITADHGNCDMMWDEKHVPVTSHTTSLVPFIITKENLTLKNGKLADIAPTMLSLLSLDVPEEMTGENLVESEK